jgi:hypothetical protein
MLAFMPVLKNGSGYNACFAASRVFRSFIPLYLAAILDSFPVVLLKTKLRDGSGMISSNMFLPPVLSLNRFYPGKHC